MSKKPLLLKLRGSTVLDPNQRSQFDVPSGLFTREVKKWSDVKDTIDNYFFGTDQIWDDTAADFHTTLTTTLERIAAISTNTLLSNYCSRLIDFYNSKNTKKVVMNYYSRSELRYRAKQNEIDRRNQTSSTTSILLTEEARAVEEEARQRMFNGESSSSRAPQMVSFGGNESDDESIDSVEKHPHAKNYYDYFAQDKKQGWSIEDTNSHWITADRFDVTPILFKYRRDSYKAARLMSSISDERILSLSFVFIINQYHHNEGFLNMCRDKEESIRNSLGRADRCQVPGEAVMIANEIDNKCGVRGLVEEYLSRIHANYYDSSQEITLYYNVLYTFFRITNQLEYHHTEQDHDCYEIFTKEIFHSNKYLTHKMSKHLESCSEFIPDYKVAYEYKKKKVLDLFIIEIKKEEKSYTPDSSDKIKINLEMQVMLNQLIKENVGNSVVYGLIIQDHNCYLYEMQLKNDAQYISRIVEEFHLPRDIYGVCLVPCVTAIFLSIRNKVDSLIERINNKSRVSLTFSLFMRDSMGMPLIVENPICFPCPCLSHLSSVSGTSTQSKS